MHVYHLFSQRSGVQTCKGNLYTEQLSGTAFTAPRSQNLRSWLYRKHPSVGHEPFKLQASRPLAALPGNSSVTPNQLRWLPPDEVDEGIDFVDALFTVCGSGKYVLPPAALAACHFCLNVVVMQVRAVQPAAEGGICCAPLHSLGLHAGHQPHQCRWRLSDRPPVRYVTPHDISAPLLPNAVSAAESLPAQARCTSGQSLDA